MDNPRKRFAISLRRGLFPVFLLTVFWQTRFAFWGRHQIYDYSIPFIYLGDLFVLVFLCVSFWEKRNWLTSWLRRNIWALMLFVAMVVVVFIPAGDLVNTVGFVYRVVKLLVFFIFSIYVTSFWGKAGYNRIVGLISVGLVPIVLIAVLQVLLGESIGSRLMGIWEFSSQLPGIATVRIGGEMILRAYGTFPHPNVMGGVLAAILIYWFVRWQKNTESRGLNGFFICIFGLGLLLTFSRGAWLGAIGVVLYLELSRRFQTSQLRVRKRWGLIILAGTILTLALIAPRVIQVVNEDQLSVTRRVELNNVALRIIKEHPFFGVGVNQFVYYVSEYWGNFSISRFVQPVHNIFLLVFAESGMVGGVLFMGFGLILVQKVRKIIPYEIGAMWLVVAITGLFDHYWLTVQAGLIFITLTLGITLATIDNNGSRE